MKVKKLITLIETLAMTGLVSVGFSSWLIIETNPAILEGKVNVEDVFDNNDYVVIKNVSFSDWFGGVDGGFYTDYIFSTTYSSTAVLEFDVVIDLNKYRTELKTTPSSASLDIQLGYSKLHNGETNGNFLDVISRSLTKTASSADKQGSLTTVFSYKYDNGTVTSLGNVSGTQVGYSTSTPAPNVDRIINFTNISSVNTITLSAVYSFKLDNGWQSSDWMSIAGNGVPFYIYATLENA